MEFEFDPQKSQSNQVKHDINFDKAQELWLDGNRIEIPAKVEDEDRYLVIGKIDKIYWSAVITYRDSKIRIISVRRSRKEEKDIYES